MKARVWIIMVLSFFIIIGCTPTNANKDGKEAQSEAEEKTDDQVTGADFTISVETVNGVVTIDKKPERILPLSLDVAEIVFELVDPDKIVAIPNSVGDSILSSNSDKAGQVSNRVSSAVNIDPEEVLSYEADLLLLTKTHGQEDDANKILQETGLPMLTFETIGTVEEYFKNIETIGKAVGEADLAEELILNLRTKVEEIQQKIPGDAESPSVLILSEVGPGTGPFMMGPGNISYDLIQLAQAVPAVDAIGLQSSIPASIELVMNMEPDFIFLLDFVGNGEETYTELMENPGWSDLESVKNDRVMILPVKYMMNPNVEIIEGLDIMVDRIYRLEE
ncbi:iron complex transport system substrate-binding protein [Gracilibacillus halotolerans]|uniref:Iron complex transport system substrate-binding protein n=1 Tax=Gracilibacillus halotolerans TaxID=74386 RepID=A0A841RQ79_9BACI|nr:ABC transporter substrate-binding protein [Gracilibacillus halotolerans]MBB6514012.1 iron complex transport system substrate-binding protein [Gracilibacillus halotolerans]